ncbi:MAG: transglutaminase family protein [Pirellulales bacterium]|nr:transglutaminase family protein [Pirellulales bacterium]
MSRRTWLALPLVVTLVLLPEVARAQFDARETPDGTPLGPSSTRELRIGMIVTAGGAPCRGIVATAPVPIDWPEQRVRVVEEDFSPNVREIDYRNVGDTVRQMVLDMPVLAAGEEARAILVLEIERSQIPAPTDTSGFIIPKKLDKFTRLYLGPSPYIESRDPKIKSAAKEAIEGKETAWEQVEGIYDWVRDRVTYEEGPLKGALAALRDGNGDCEELSSLFIAMCRAIKVPARTVWVPGHCYPEFYLEDTEGKGHWFPCQAAGDRSFGTIVEPRPILQKGDNFLVPERSRDRQRYVSEYLTGKGGNPKVKFVREFDGKTFN